MLLAQPLAALQVQEGGLGPPCVSARRYGPLRHSACRGGCFRLPFSLEAQGSAVLVHGRGPMMYYRAICSLILAAAIAKAAWKVQCHPENCPGEATQLRRAARALYRVCIAGPRPGAS